MKAGIAAAVALVGLLGGGAMAEDLANDGNYLLGNCTIAKRYMDETPVKATEADFFRGGFCLGVVEGVRNTMLLLESLIDKSRRTCFPEKGINNGQAVRIVLKYLNEHPADLHQDQTYLALMAFRDAYHCK